MWARSRIPSPISPSRSMIGGASSPGAIGRSSSDRSPSVRARKSTSIRSSSARAVMPERPQRADPLHLARIDGARVVLQDRLEVGVHAHEGAVRKALERLVEGVLVEVVVAVGALERLLQLALVTREDHHVALDREEAVAALVERRAGRLADLPRLQLVDQGRRARPRPSPCPPARSRSSCRGDRLDARGAEDDRVPEHGLQVLVVADPAARLLELPQQVAGGLVHRRGTCRPACPAPGTGRPRRRCRGRSRAGCPSAGRQARNRARCPSRHRPRSPPRQARPSRMRRRVVASALRPLQPPPPGRGTRPRRDPARAGAPGAGAEASSFLAGPGSRRGPRRPRGVAVAARPARRRAP